MQISHINCRSFYPPPTKKSRFTLNEGSSLTVIIYKLATFPFGVVIMSVWVEAVEQIICIHTCRLFSEKQICNVENMLKICCEIQIQDSMNTNTALGDSDQSQFHKNDHNIQSYTGSRSFLIGIPGFDSQYKLCTAEGKCTIRF